MKHVVDCIDAGSEYCPCYLAETGECITCSQLQGKDFCDCKNWKGVCIYQEYVWNRHTIKEGRKNFLCRILEKERVSDAVVILTIEVTKTLARELNQAGAYVFLRGAREPYFFDTPMSIMTADAERGTIKAALQVRGVKTKSLGVLDDEVYLRGPYWNGLLGLQNLKKMRGQRALLVTRGIGQAPALPVARKLVMAGNEVDVILDPGRAGVCFAEPYYRELGCGVVVLPLLDNKLSVPEESLAIIKSMVEEKGVSLVYSGGSDKLHEGIGRLVSSLDKDISFCCSNDAKFCCGEGVCGSCQTRLPDGSRIKTCKTQLSPIELFERSAKKHNG